MIKYVFKRILLMLVALFCITTICFMLIRALPMTPPEGINASQEQVIKEIWDARGYNKPLIQQYGIYLKDVVTEFDFGTSWKIKSTEPAWDLLTKRLAPTVLVNLYSLLFSLPIGIAFGIYAAIKKNKWQDHAISTGVMLQNLRTSNLDNDMNLTRDGYHMDNGISRYGASCTVFESIITPKFNVTMDGNSYRFATSDTGESSYTTPVTDVNAPVAIQAARYAIQSPYTVTDMSNYQENVPGNSIGDVEYKEGSKE